MSSPTTEMVVAVAADAVTVVDTVVKAPRRFPPPCWTQEETLALIEAYRERWYALRRGYLRTADWDAVAAAVATRCPGASPAKTCAQCRHKMEKLRQRYRAEKQRTVSVPYPGGRYFSSWFFFENMEAMENGTAAPTAVQKAENSSDESQLKSFLDQNVLKLKLKAKSNADSSPVSGYDNSIKPKRSTQIAYPPFSNTEIPDKSEEEFPGEDEYMTFGRRQQPIYGIPKPKSKNSIKTFNSFDIPQIRKFDPIADLNNNNSRRNPNDEFLGRINNDIRPKYWEQQNPDSGGQTHGLKRGSDGIEEIVESIKLLGEGFMKVEKAKMEMAREMEATRMEMEMKRNEMLLESQKQIVEAFLKGFFEIRKNKKHKSRNITADSSEK
ncbi:hypothetical protein ACS0TY_016322 [Phlomoides rotata]